MYNYTNPKMKEVAKLCEKGFWPICKNQNGQFAVFTPIFNKRGQIVRSGFYLELEDAKRNLTSTYHEGQELQPTEIVDFYHPPTPKFEVGDKVRVREDLANLQLEPFSDYKNFLQTAGEIGIVEGFTNFDSIIVNIGNIGKNTFIFSLSELEPALETEPVKKTVTLTLTDEQLAEINKILGK